MSARASRSEGSRSRPQTLTCSSQGCCSAGSVAWRLAGRTLGEAAGAEGAAAAGLASAAGAAAAAGGAAPAACPAAHLLLRCAGLPPAPSWRASTAFSSLAATVGPPKLPLSVAVVAAARLPPMGLAAALPLRVMPALLSRAGLIMPPQATAVRQHSSNAPLQRWEPRWAQRTTASAVDAPAALAASGAAGQPAAGQPAAAPTDSVEGSPRRQFERWLDEMYEQGFQVQLDKKQGSVELEGPGGQRMRLWLKQERFPHLEWVLAGSVALFLAFGGKEAGWTAALMYMGIWAGLPRLIVAVICLGMIAVLEKLFGALSGS